MLYKDIYHRHNIEILYEDIAPDNIDNLKRYCEYRDICKGFLLIQMDMYIHIILGGQLKVSILDIGEN